jgi:hypothetical protein
MAVNPNQKVETGPPETTEPLPTNWMAQLPPWGQILDNYGAEPVLLGMDRCRAYRDAVPPEQRMIAPAGMFSTGTNLLYTLLISNCLPPPVIDDNITQAESEKTRSGRPKYAEAVRPVAGSVGGTQPRAGEASLRHRQTSSCEPIRRVSRCDDTSSLHVDTHHLQTFLFRPLGT